MNAPIFISPRVLNTINSLPDTDRKAIATAIAGEFILGSDAASDLTPIQSLVFAIIRNYVERDTYNMQHGR